MGSIAECLSASKSFSHRYYIKVIPLFYEGGAPLLERQLRRCKLFIYQEIREVNQFGKEYSTDRLMSLLPKRCKCVSVPNLYELGYGFFPQCLNRENTPKYLNDHNPSYKGDERGLFVHVDKFIAEMIEDNRSLRDILKIVKSDDYLSEKAVRELFDEYLNKIMERERNLDIKIYDFLIENYKDVQLFNDFGHPTGIVLKTISERLLVRLGLKNDLMDYTFKRELEEYGDPIYPCVAKALGLKYTKEYVREQSDKKLTEYMDFEEYVKEYYYWCQ